MLNSPFLNLLESGLWKALLVQSYRSSGTYSCGFLMDMRGDAMAFLLSVSISKGSLFSMCRYLHLRWWRVFNGALICVEYLCSRGSRLWIWSSLFTKNVVSGWMLNGYLHVRGRGWVCWDCYYVNCHLGLFLTVFILSAGAGGGGADGEGSVCTPQCLQIAGNLRQDCMLGKWWYCC